MSKNNVIKEIIEIAFFLLYMGIILLANMRFPGLYKMDYNGIYFIECSPRSFIVFALATSLYVILRALVLRLIAQIRIR